MNSVVMRHNLVHVFASLTLTLLFFWLRACTLSSTVCAAVSCQPQGAPCPSGSSF